MPLARIVLARAEPEIGAHGPAPREALRILQRQHEAQRRQRAHAGYLAEPTNISRIVKLSCLAGQT